VAGRVQPLFGLYPSDYAVSLQRYFGAGERKLVQWCLDQHPVIVDWPGNADPFTNINDTATLLTVEQKLTLEQKLTSWRDTKL
jgi:molybdopterin-guanine dinucleotide biosynthesis protein A